MKHDRFLMYALCVIILINIIAIILLNNRLAAQERRATLQPGQTGNTGQEPGVQPAQPAIRTQPVVRTLILEDKTLCPDCFDISQYVTALNDTINMAVETVKPADLAAFNMTRLPAIAFNSTLENYSTIVRGWDQAGYTVTIPSGEYEGLWYVLPTQNPPYYSLADRRTHGLVTVTYLTMNSCAECYNATMLRDSLAASRIIPWRETSVDVESPQGRALVARYNITAVPTILMDREAGEYTNIQPGWSLVGTVEEDGTHVLRDLQKLQVTYYDLALKKLMKP